MNQLITDLTFNPKEGGFKNNWKCLTLVYLKNDPENEN